MADETPLPAANEPLLPVPGFRQDLAVLVKVRLNLFVLITTLFGFLLASRGQTFDWWLLTHTLIGTAAAAFGSAAFNQLMEIDLDKRMRRTADRPLPARRMDPMVAFGVGWVLSAFGILHLAVRVNAMAAMLTAATIAIYVFIYTPLKRFSSTNTLVGAIPGAIPPMIGWTAALDGDLGFGAWFLFSLLFLWQLPHFVAINWMCREEYEAAGYKMWSDGDASGNKSGLLCILFSLMLAVVSLASWLTGATSWVWNLFGPALALIMAFLSWQFRRVGDRPTARKLFFFTLIYLPASLGLLAIAWR
jgi:protoheme IX farnesyltransferase